MKIKFQADADFDEDKQNSPGVMIIAQNVPIRIAFRVIIEHIFC